MLPHSARSSATARSRSAVTAGLRANDARGRDRRVVSVGCEVMDPGHLPDADRRLRHPARHGRRGNHAYRQPQPRAVERHEVRQPRGPVPVPGRGGRVPQTGQRQGRKVRGLGCPAPGQKEPERNLRPHQLDTLERALPRHQARAHRAEAEGRGGCGERRGLSRGLPVGRGLGCRAGPALLQQSSR